MVICNGSILGSDTNNLSLWMVINIGIKCLWWLSRRTQWRAERNRTTFFFKYTHCCDLYVWALSFLNVIFLSSLTEIFKKKILILVWTFQFLNYYQKSCVLRSCWYEKVIWINFYVRVCEGNTFIIQKQNIAETKN